MSASVLITGGLGYIGGRVAQALVVAGFQVRCGTRQSAVHAPKWLPDMHMVRLDWDSDDALERACRGVDSVVHLAAMNEIESAQNPKGALQMNAMATLRLLETAKRVGIRRFVYFSTAHIYGAPLQGDISETTLPRPVHPYAITHKTAEDFVLAAHDQRQIEGIVVRLSNGFGAPATASVDRWTLLVNDLCRQAVSTGALRLNSAGTQMRDFIPLADVATATEHLLGLDTARIDDGLFNLGSGASMPILTMTERVAERYRVLTGADIPIIRPDVSSGPVATLHYRCDKLLATGFQPRREVDREIDDTLQLCLLAFGQ